jgi:enoyl-[acyl-carrier protein] reductase I
MPIPPARPIIDLSGKIGLVLGIANEHSIATGCAQRFVDAGAHLVATYLDDKARPFVEPVARALPCDLLLPCDVRVDGALESVFTAIRDRYGRLDFLLHTMAFAPREDLHARVTDCSAAGFALAMDVSCHSFIRCARLAEPLMAQGGALLSVSFYGAERVVEHYNLMGPVKAALESSVRYLAAELGPRHIRVNAVSPGPIATRAASGIDRFDELLERAAHAAPEHQRVTIGDVGALAAFLASDAGARITGSIIPVDGGQHIMA